LDKDVNVNYIQPHACLVPKPQFKITRTRSTQRNIAVIISNFWACSCRPIHTWLLLCSVLQVYMDKK